MEMRLKCSATLLLADKPASILIKTRKRCVHLLRFLLRTWLLWCTNSWGRGSSLGLYIIFLNKPRQPLNQSYIRNKMHCFPALNAIDWYFSRFRKFSPPYVFKCFVFLLMLDRLQIKSGRSSPDLNGSANTKMVMRCSLFLFLCLFS